MKIGGNSYGIGAAQELINLFDMATIFGQPGKWWIPLVSPTVTTDGWAVNDYDVQCACYGSGVHVGSYTGQGTVSIIQVSNQGAPLAMTITSAPGAGVTTFTVTINLKPGTDYPVWRVRSSNPANPVRYCKFVQQKYTTPTDRTSQIWTDEFLQAHKGLDTFRTMQLQAINNNTTGAAITWANRKTPITPFCVGVDGVPLEWLAVLAQQLGCNLHVCIPDTADDTYITGAVPLLLAALPLGKTLTVEDSNEIWNSAFSQFSRVYAAAQTNTALTAAASDPYGRLWQQMGFRAKHISDVAKAAAGAAKGKCRIQLGCQFVSPSSAATLLSYVDTTYGPPQGYFDAAGIGAYAQVYTVAEAPGWTLDFLLSQTLADTQSQFPIWLGQWDTLLSKYLGIVLSAYECGPQYYGVPKSNPLSANNAIKQQAGQDARMGGIIATIFQLLAADGVDVANFYVVCMPDAVNSDGFDNGFGAEQTLGQTPVPVKMAALQAAVALYNTPAPAPAKTLKSVTTTYTYVDGSTEVVARP